MHRQLMPKILSKKLVSIREAAQILSVSIDTLRRWDKKGILKSLRPNGKDRYFSIEELEKIKFSKPLTISQAAQELKISQSTLRRLDKKGLIKPEKTKNGERLYSKKALEDFLHSEYFLRQKEVENEILQPLTEVENQISDNKTERAETSHKVIGAIINKTTNEVSNLNFSRKIFLGAAMFVFLIFIFTIIGIVVMFLARPIDTARFFGIATIPEKDKIISYFQNDKAVLGTSTKRDENKIRGSVLGAVLKPFAGISLEIVRQVNPSTYEVIVPTRIVKDTSNNAIFFLNEKEIIVPQYPLRFSKSASLQIDDNELVSNFNAEYVQGKIPGNSAGNLVVFEEDGKISNLRVESLNLSGGSVIGGTGGIILDGSVTAADLADGTITASKLAQITTANKVAGSSIQLATGGGLVNNSGLSLLTTCTNSQLLAWNGSAWACSSTSSSGVSSLNSLTGGLSIAGSGINSVGASGSTITITATEADTLTTITGRGATTSTGISLSGGLTVSSGTITFSDFVSSGGLIYTNGSGALSQVTAGSSNQVLHGGTTPSFSAVSLVTDVSGILPTSSGGSFWNSSAGALYPGNSTLDLLVGGTTSASAKFAVTNISSGTPTASISANSGNDAATFTGTGILGTTNAQTLTLGNSTTGEIVLAPGGTTALTARGANLIASGTLTGLTGLTLTSGGITLGGTTGTGSQCLLGGATAAWGSCAAGASSNWDIINGVITPKLTSTLDFLLGSQSSSSAKFAVLNMTGALTPTASISAGAAGGALLTATGNLQTTAKQSLTLGGGNSGNIVLSGFGAGVIQSNASGVLSSTSVGETNTIVYTTAANTLSSIATANSGVLVTDGSGVPSISTTLPAVSGANLTGLTSSQVGLGNVENTALSTWAGSANLTTLGTIPTGVWQVTSFGFA